MYLKVSFDEIKALVKANANQVIDLSSVDNKAVCLRVDVRLGAVLGHELRKNISVKLHVVEMRGKDLVLAYDAGSGVDMLLAGAQMLFPQLRQVKMVELPEKGRAVVHLAMVDGLGKTLDKADVKDISFECDSAVIDFTLK